MTATSPRGAATRALLLETSARLIEQGGVAALTLRAVADAAQISRQTPYRHFESKHALLEEVALGWFASLTQTLRETYATQPTNASAPERLEALLHAFVEVIAAHPMRYQLMLGPELRGAPRIDAASQDAFAVIAHAVDACRAELRIEAPSLELAALIYAAVHGIADLAASGFLTQEKGVAPETLVRRLTLLLGAPR